MKRGSKERISYSGIYIDAEIRKQELEAAQKVLEKSLSKAPEGNIRIIRVNGSAQYYLRMKPNDKNGTYLSKSNTKQIKMYLQKSYDLKAKKLVDEELKNLTRCLGKNVELPHKLEQLYSNYPEEARIHICPVSKSYEEMEREWMARPYRRLDVNNVNAGYETNRGELVRSKSELNIANMLDHYHIAYKYECPVVLNNGIVVHPDFTVLNRDTGEEIYWEHRGMMDDSGYASKAVFKFKKYMQSGIILEKNLIITEETSLNPLGTDEIKVIIKSLL
jgi:hypothetical protein